VKALYDYTGEEDEELSFRAGDIIAVTDTPEDGWWSGELVTDLTNRRSPAPSNSAAQPSAQKKAKTAAQTATSVPRTVLGRVQAMFTFEPTEGGELGFRRGDIITVVDKKYKDWWRGELKERTGIFPVNYVVRSLTENKP
jgi:Variant SH3 domain/SH3 domain